MAVKETLSRRKVPMVANSANQTTRQLHPTTGIALIQSHIQPLMLKVWIRQWQVLEGLLWVDSKLPVAMSWIGTMPLTSPWTSRSLSDLTMAPHSRELTLITAVLAAVRAMESIKVRSESKICTIWRLRHLEQRTKQISPTQAGIGQACTVLSRLRARRWAHKEA